MENKKRDKFIELAENRVNKALKDIQLISNLSNTKAYSYTKKDTDKIYGVLKKAVEDMKARFEQSEDKEINFKL